MNFEELTKNPYFKRKSSHGNSRVGVSHTLCVMIPSQADAFRDNWSYHFNIKMPEGPQFISQIQSGSIQRLVCVHIFIHFIMQHVYILMI